MGTTAEDLERAVRGYMDACTAGDAEAIAAFLTDDARHYFPPDMYDGPWVGARASASGGRTRCASGARRGPSTRSPSTRGAGPRPASGPTARAPPG